MSGEFNTSGGLDPSITGGVIASSIFSDEELAQRFETEIEDIRLNRVLVDPILESASSTDEVAHQLAGLEVLSADAKNELIAYAVCRIALEAPEVDLDGLDNLFNLFDNDNYRETYAVYARATSAGILAARTDISPLGLAQYIAGSRSVASKYFEDVDHMQTITYDLFHGLAARDGFSVERTKMLALAIDERANILPDGPDGKKDWNDIWLAVLDGTPVDGWATTQIDEIEAEIDLSSERAEGGLREPFIVEQLVKAGFSNPDRLMRRLDSIAIPDGAGDALQAASTLVAHFTRLGEMEYAQLVRERWYSVVFAIAGTPYEIYLRTYYGGHDFEQLVDFRGLGIKERLVGLSEEEAARLAQYRAEVENARHKDLTPDPIEEMGEI